MTEQQEIKLTKKRNIATKVFFIMAVTFGLVMVLLLVGFSNFNSNRVIYLRFSVPIGDERDIPITRIELTSSTTGSVSDTNETTISRVYRFDLYDNSTTNPRNAPKMGDVATVFNERIVTDRNLHSFTLIVYIFIDDNIMALTASLDINFDICSLSITNLNATSREVLYTVDEVNPIFEFISFL